MEMDATSITHEGVMKLFLEHVFFVLTVL